MKKIVEQLLLYIEEEHLLEAQDLIAENEMAFGSDVEFLKAAALFYIKIGKCYLAVSLLHKAREISPNDREIDYYLSYAYEFRTKDTPDETQLSAAQTLPAARDLPKNLLTEREQRQNMFLDEDAPLVSIIVSCAAGLAETALCIQHAIKYSENIDYELILINNGLPEEVTSYFLQVPGRKKKIVEIKNYIDVLSFQLGIKEATGKYFLFMDDSVLVTANWLKNMVICISSDITIGLVAPASNFNYDGGEGIFYKKLEQLEEKAALFNISAQRKWKQMLIFTGRVFLCRKACVDTIGFYDYGFCGALNADLSFRYRRGGYKLMVCGDVFVHHHSQNHQDFAANRADYMRFAGKYCGIRLEEDAVMDAPWPFPLLAADVKPRIEVLGIEVKCGGRILSLKNLLTKAGAVDVRLSSFISDAKYWLDLKTICDGDVYCDSAEFLMENFGGKTFDHIVLGQALNRFDQPFAVLRQILLLLKEDGKCYVELENLQNVELWNKCTKGKADQDETGGGKRWVISKEKLMGFFRENNVFVIKEIDYSEKNYDAAVLKTLFAKMGLPPRGKLWEKWVTKKYLFAIEKRI